MRELRLLKWCDMCWQETETQQEAVNSYSVGICSGESRPALKLVELCDTHQKVLVDLLALLANIGTTPDLIPKKSTKPVAALQTVRPTKPCPVCHELVGENVLVTHVWRMHRDDERPPMPKVCPQCRAQVETGTGMSAHMRNVHQYSALDDALSGVKGYKP